jgi:hypothetical protein
VKTVTKLKRLGRHEPRPSPLRPGTRSPARQWHAGQPTTAGLEDARLVPAASPALRGTARYADCWGDLLQFIANQPPNVGSESLVLEVGRQPSPSGSGRAMGGRTMAADAVATARCRSGMDYLHGHEERSVQPLAVRGAHTSVVTSPDGCPRVSVGLSSSP